MDYVHNAKAPTLNSAYTVSTPARERNPDCIENVLKQIEVALGESVNSSENLADKLRGSEKADSLGQATPTPSDIQSRLQQILRMVTIVNQELGHAHNAISG